MAVTLLIGTWGVPPCVCGAWSVIWISFGPAAAAARTWGGGSWVCVTAWTLCWVVVWLAPLCFFLWWIRLLESANLESQCWHAYGLSPVWTLLLWTTNLSDLRIKIRNNFVIVIGYILILYAIVKKCITFNLSSLHTWQNQPHMFHRRRVSPMCVLTEYDLSAFVSWQNFCHIHYTSDLQPLDGHLNDMQVLVLIVALLDRLDTWKWCFHAS